MNISKMFSNDESTDMLLSYAKSNFGKKYVRRAIPESKIKMLRRLETNLRGYG